MKTSAAKRCRQWASIILSTALLSACASLPPPDIASTGRTEQFWLSARFSLVVDRPDQAPQTASGQLDWWHDSMQQRDRIDIASPFGQTMAALRGNAASVRLQLANGRQFQASTLTELAQQGLGQPIPFTRIPDWLEGITQLHSKAIRDPLGRLTQLRDNHWEVRYEYADDRINNDHPSIPQILTAQSTDGITLRLRIDRWRTGEAVPFWPED